MIKGITVVFSISSEIRTVIYIFLLILNDVLVVLKRKVPLSVDILLPYDCVRRFTLILFYGRYVTLVLSYLLIG